MVETTGAFTVGSSGLFTNEGVFDNGGATEISGVFDNRGQLTGTAPLTIAAGGELRTAADAVSDQLLLKVDGVLSAVLDETSVVLPNQVSLGETGTVDAGEERFGLSLQRSGLFAANKNVAINEVNLAEGQLAGSNQISNAINLLAVNASKIDVAPEHRKSFISTGNHNGSLDQLFIRS